MSPIRPSPLRLALLAGLALAAGSSCKGREAREEAEVRKQLKEKGTLEVLQEAEKAQFKPPKDGHLTPAQVEMYLAVRRRERLIRVAALANLKEKGAEVKEEGGKAAALGALRAVGDVGDVATAALRAAQELGYNSKEYRWVAERIEDARFAGATEGLQSRVAASRSRILALLEERARKTGDPAKRRELEEDLTLLRRRTEPLGRPPSEADRFNAALLARYSEPLAALRREEIEFYADRLGVRPAKGKDERGGELGRK